MKKSKIFLVALSILVLLFSVSALCLADYESTIATTRAYINSKMLENDMVGLSIVLVDAESSHADKVVWSEGFGLANKETGAPATPDTIFAIGSVSKAFTGLAVLLERDQGNIDLDTSVTSYIPNFTIQERYPGINQNQQFTIRRLLNMHAGIPGDLYNHSFLFSSPMYYSTYMQWILEKYLNDDYPLHPPGSFASYSNLGIVLAGHAAYLEGKTAADEDLNDYFTRTIFQPLGMTSTTGKVVGKNLPGIATGYIEGKPQTNPDSNFLATGGIYSTVNDLSQFLTVLVNDGNTASGTQFVTPGSLDEMGRYSPTNLDLDSMYQPGLGLDSVYLPSFHGVAPPVGGIGKAWGKNGSTGSYNAMIMMLPAAGQKLAVGVLTNSDTAGGAVIEIARKCLLEAIKEKLSLASDPAVKPLPDFSGEAMTDPAAIAGFYGTRSGYDKITYDGVQLSWCRNAHVSDCLDQVRLSQKTDGSNYFAVDGQDYDIVFLSRSDSYANPYQLMVQHGGQHPVFGSNRVGALGHKLPLPAGIPAVWAARTGLKFVKINIGWAWEPEWYAPTVELSQKEYFLLYTSELGTQSIIPENENLALLTNYTSRGDAALRFDNINGVENLFYESYQSVPVSTLHEHTLGIASDFTVDASDILPKNIWRKVTVGSDSSFSNKKVRFHVTPNGENYTYFFYDGDFQLIAHEMDSNSLVTPQLGEGIYYIAVAPKLGAGGSAQLISRATAPWLLFQPAIQANASKEN